MHFTSLLAGSLALIAATAMVDASPLTMVRRSVYGHPPTHYKPTYNPHASVPCTYRPDGWLDTAGCQSCPIKTHPQPPTPSTYACKPSSGVLGSLLNLDLLNCDNICILSKGCAGTKSVNCPVKTADGTLINVTALNCDDINILSS